jgi:drug/metabolite transporter (DMT)-like permease
MWPDSSSAPAPSSSSSSPAPHSAYLLAIVISLTATCVNNVGMLHMKLSLMRNAAREAPLPVCQQLRWILGFSFYLCGQIGAMVALGFGPQSMLAALGAFSLVVNVFTSPCILGERLTWFHIMATLVIVGGVCIVVMFSKKTSQHYTMGELEQMFTQDAFLSVASVLLVILLGMFLAYGPCSPRRICPIKKTAAATSRGNNNSNNTVQHDHRSKEKRLLGEPADAADAADVAADDRDGYSRMDVPSAIAAIKPLPPLYCAFIASICSAGTNLFAKCTMAILLAHNASEWYASLTFWAIVVLLGATAVGTVVFLNLGLNSDADALFIVPVFFVMVLLSTTTVAAVYFGDFYGMSAFHLAMLGVGALLTLSGVYALASFDVANDPDLEDVEDGDDDGADAVTDVDDPSSFANTLSAAPLLSSAGLEAGGLAAGGGVSGSRPTRYGSVASPSSPDSTVTRRTSVIQMRNNHRRRRSSVRFSLKPEAYVESFTMKRTRLASVIEDGGVDDAGGGWRSGGGGSAAAAAAAAAVEDGGAGRKTAPSLSRFSSAPSVSTTPSSSSSGTTIRRTFSAQPDIANSAVRPRARTRTYTATLLGGLGIA